MGTDYLVCKSCSGAFPDGIDYISCDCCGKDWCSIECATLKGFKDEKFIDAEGKEHYSSCSYCRGEMEDTVEVTISQKNILDIVMKYANKFKDRWGIDEFVHQDDDAQVEAIDLFGEIIGELPEQEDVLPITTL